MDTIIKSAHTDAHTPSRPHARGLWKAHLIVDQCSWALENSIHRVPVHSHANRFFFYKRQWMDQSHDGTSYNPASTYPGHTLPLSSTPFFFFKKKVLTCGVWGGWLHCPLVFKSHGGVALSTDVGQLLLQSPSLVFPAPPAPVIIWTWCLFLAVINPI